MSKHTAMVGYVRRHGAPKCWQRRAYDRRAARWLMRRLNNAVFDILLSGARIP